MIGQRELFGHEAPAPDLAFATLSRVELAHGAWYDYAPGWLCGHAALFEAWQRELPWQQHDREMYGRIVDVPRLHCSLDAIESPVIAAIRTALARRYGEPFPSVSAALYRDGKDSVAWHGDTISRYLPDALVATVSVGAPRTFMLRPRGGGASRSLRLGGGDLLVMGGSSQRTWEHAVPKVAHAQPRIVIMLRPRASPP